MKRSNKTKVFTLTACLACGMATAELSYSRGVPPVDFLAKGFAEAADGAARSRFMLSQGIPVDGSNSEFRVCGDAEIFFVTNKSDKPMRGYYVAKVSGKQPEFWNPENGERERVRLWREKDGRTGLVVAIPPYGSLFVVFRGLPLAHAVEFNADREYGDGWRIREDSGLPSLQASEPVTAKLTMSDGRTIVMSAKSSGACETKIEAYPRLMTCNDGSKVKTVRDWEEKRRPEILDMFRKYVYGYNAVERPDSLAFSQAEPDKVMMDGKALRKRVRASWKGPYGTNSFVFTAFMPTSKTTPVPAFLLICNRNADENIDPTRERKSPFWPAEQIVSRGYAAVAFKNTDIAPDAYDGFVNGVYRQFENPGPSHRPQRRADAWGALGAWAWGASRVMDWIETESLIDAKRVAVIGHSRGGKTALWCGVQDQRFAMAISSCSGCAGARMYRGRPYDSEPVETIYGYFRHWFCRNFGAFADNEEALPIDQHELIALMAPRLVCVGSASQDAWAGPPAELEAAKQASPAWALYGKKGIGDVPFPKPDATAYQDGCISYHLRDGEHNLKESDWKIYMDFADKHWSSF